MQRPNQVAWLGAAISLLACTASVDAPGGGQLGPSGNGSGSPAGPSETSSPSDSAASEHMRRLSRTEYNNTLRDLLGVGGDLSQAFASDVDANGSGYLRGGVVSTVDADQLREAAEKVGTDVATRLPALLPCTPLPTNRADEDACASRFIQSLARRAYRRSAVADEAQALVDYYSKVRADLGYGFSDALRLVIQVTVQSPNFLYRWELGNAPALREGDLVRFNDDEIAARLSYALWGSMPDQELFAAADHGELRTPEQLASQARRLLADQKAFDMFDDFDAQWLGLLDLKNVTKDTGAYPSFSAELARSMDRERREFLSFVLGPNGDGKLQTLLTAAFSFVDAKLAPLYGVTPGATDAFQQVMLDPAQRAGILTQPAFLTAHAAPGGSHPIKRGKQILLRLLCEELPPPPPNVPALPPPAPGLTTRERFAQHGQNACAAGCHEKMDPLGFAFEHYDGMGAYRLTEADTSVDASGTVLLDGTSQQFGDAVALNKLLATSGAVRSCMTRQLLRYAIRRREATGDEASLTLIDDAFARSDYDLREALVALVSSRTFAYRKPAPGEVLP